MDEKNFKLLLQGVRELKAVKGGKLKRARVREITPLGVKKIRTRVGLSQSQFAEMIRVPVATLQNWEQGRTRPDGPAQALLAVTARNPKAVMEALH